MRGANCRNSLIFPNRLETSPHAWSKHRIERILPGRFRNISTCVEQTQLRLSLGDLNLETSPHAWSKRRQATGMVHSVRNISTCVEQTVYTARKKNPSWKHLHMRGANIQQFLVMPGKVETSPHAWSKRTRHPSSPGCPRNISTCVEQTCTRSAARARNSETSPHAWSKLNKTREWKSRLRNISTCVEQTPLFQDGLQQNQKHLHMRGANTLDRNIRPPPWETSPHAWSKQFGSKIC